MGRHLLLTCSLGVLLLSSSGCLFVRHATRVVRQDEKPRSVQFESESARNLFEAGLADVKAHPDTGANPQIVAVPLLFWYSSTDQLSDAAIYNDQVLACDRNGDSFITLQEATAFREQAGAKAAAAAKQSAPGEASVAQQPPKTPPGIIVR